VRAVRGGRECACALSVRRACLSYGRLLICALLGALSAVVSLMLEDSGVKDGHGAARVRASETEPL
jgi:hypothetical protein